MRRGPAAGVAGEAGRVPRARGHHLVETPRNRTRMRSMTALSRFLG
ncbi:hypothetical protein CZ771_01870 [Actinomycetales bacterium JB111]|nr:hypothetical protein CZ771_01870 [Actinomycetales bacterium JB111]